MESILPYLLLNGFMYFCSSQGAATAATTEETWISHPPPCPRAGTKYHVQANPSLRFAIRVFGALIKNDGFNKQMRNSIEQIRSITFSRNIFLGEKRRYWKFNTRSWRNFRSYRWNDFCISNNLSNLLS